MAVALHIRGVSKAFGALSALDDVSLDIAPGELFFLLGPSGCGKTTLLRSIAGFCEPDSGSIQLGDREIIGVPPHRRDTGMVFQSYALWPHLTVRQNVAFGLEMRTLSKAEIAARTDEALAQVHMTDKCDARPNTLSGGQQQRVALARALAVRPQCLLLDEPLSNLDAKLRLEMRGEIRRICKNGGLTAVYVTHDQKEALSIADRLAVMHQGRVAQVGTPYDVYRTPGSVFVASFIGETNLLQGRVIAHRGESVEVDTVLGRMQGRSPVASLQEGASVTVSIRPEAVQLMPPPGLTCNRFSGQLAETVYMGEVAQHRVQVRTSDGGAGPALNVYALNPSGLAHPGMLALAVAPDDVVVLEG
ncbi:MAG TPA: spermidine/putrescine ABC transporter ATP-binding protein [Verrucomicrobia bacterium]|nr:spermidine/putrescine ABC transporter ATP-binding protein [Verrucomicrobiota bacterium]